MQFVGQLNSVPSWKFNRFSLVWAASVLRPLSNSWMQTVPALWPHRCIWKNGAALDAQIQCISRQEWMDFMMGPQGTRSDAASCFFLRSKKNQLSSNFQDLEVCAVYLQAMQMRRMWRSAFSSLTRPAYWNESDSAKSKAAAVPAGCLTMFPVCPDLPWFGLAPWPGLFWPIDKFKTQFLKDFQIALLMHLPFYNFPKGVQNLCRVSGGELIRIHKDLQGILVIHVLPLSQLHPIIAEWAHCKCQLVALVIVHVVLVVYWSIDLSYEVKNLNSWVISMDVTL